MIKRVHKNYGDKKNIQSNDLSLPIPSGMFCECDLKNVETNKQISLVEKPRRTKNIFFKDYIILTKSLKTDINC